MSVQRRKIEDLHIDHPTHHTLTQSIPEKPVVKKTTKATAFTTLLTNRLFLRLLILRSIGNFLILFALFGVSMTIGPALFYEIKFHVDTFRGVHYVVDTPQTKSQLGNIKTTTTQIITPPDTLYSIVIPKIGASSRVIINVDPSNETEYLAALKEGIAHAKGTVFPGMKGTSFYFAHSTDNFWDVGRYNAVFYLLKDLSVGDDIYLFFNNYRYNYKVTDTKIVDPNDVSALVDAQKDTEEKIVLQTCWPPGTTWKRLLVTAKPVK